MKILITGGGGYKGSVLVEKLLAIKKIKQISVIDTFWFGNYLKKNKKLKIQKKNIIDITTKDLNGVNTIIHLAEIANDPASELNPKLTWENSCLGMRKVCEIAKTCKVKKIIYASSGSVYGVKNEKKVTEKLSLEPISDYNKTKMVTERILLSYKKSFKVFIIRPGTVYGYSPRMRLDLTLNILTFKALKFNKIDIFGGAQIRPMIHIDDITDMYKFFLLNNVKEGIYNASNENISILSLAKIIKDKVNNKIKLNILKSNDPRSYRLDNNKVKKAGFIFKKNINDGINDIIYLFKNNKIKDKPTSYSINYIKKLK